MTRTTLYSRSRPKAAAATPPAAPSADAAKDAGTKARLRDWLRRHRAVLLAGIPGVAALAFVLVQQALAPRQIQTTQEDIDAAVTRSLETVPVPSHSTRAYEAVRGSIVRVRSFHEGPDGGEFEGSVGTGVVILDKGVILTNIHVVAGAKRIGLVFADGLEADAVVTGTRPEDDLAVLQAAAVPDDLQAATLQSTSGLAPGGVLAHHTWVTDVYMLAQIA